jgi:isoquinoline 1-oxidoreductase
MSEEKRSSEMPLEPERYELSAPPSYHFDFERREFLQVLGGGIVVLLTLEASAAQESGGRRRRFDELRVPIDSVRLVMGDTDLTPFDFGTFGSRTTPTMAMQLRKASAAARELLIDQAAELWKVDRGSLVAADGSVSSEKTKRSATFGELTKGMKIVTTISEDAPTTPAERWAIAGRSIPKVEGSAFVTGAHRFTSDLKVPDMWYGKVLRLPSFGATLLTLDTSKAKAMTDVVVVHDGDFVGAAAPSEERAARAVEAMRAEWKTTPQPTGRELFDYLKNNPREAQGWRGPSRHVVGSMERGLGAADKRLEASYTVAYIAHAPLEPRAALARWEDGKLTVWTGTQRPFGVRGELAEAFHLSENRVRVLVPDTGSGYGGKHTGETAIEAARLAKAVGRAVKLVWTREEEFTWAYFRPAGVIDVKSGVAGDGTITAWEFHNYNSGASAIRGLYEIPNQHIEFHPAHSPLRQGSYRALAATANHFARETHIDELADSIGMDPLEFRVKNLKDERLVAVLRAAAKRFGWDERKPQTDRGFGIAGGFEKGGYVATCAEVSIERPRGKVKIQRLVTAFECGAIVNPDDLKNQVEGSLIMGLGGALFEAIDFADGKIDNSRFSLYRVPRFSDVPILDTILLDRKDLPSAGAGETPIVCVAPAVGNAIFRATGVRHRSLPMVPVGLKEA